MKRLILPILALLALLLSACAAETAEQAPPQAGDGPIVTVFRAPT